MSVDTSNTDNMADTLSAINIEQLTNAAVGAFTQNVNFPSNITLSSAVSNSSDTSSQQSSSSTSVPAITTMSLMLPVQDKSSLPVVQGTLPPILPLIRQSGLPVTRQLISPIQSQELTPVQSNPSTAMKNHECSSISEHISHTVEEKSDSVAIPILNAAQTSAIASQVTSIIQGGSQITQLDSNEVEGNSQNNHLQEDSSESQLLQNNNCILSDVTISNLQSLAHTILNNPTVQSSIPGQTLLSVLNHSNSLITDTDSLQVSNNEVLPTSQSVDLSQILVSDSTSSHLLNSDTPLSQTTDSLLTSSTYLRQLLTSQIKYDEQLAHGSTSTEGGDLSLGQVESENTDQEGLVSISVTEPQVVTLQDATLQSRDHIPVATVYSCPDYLLHNNIYLQSTADIADLSLVNNVAMETVNNAIKQNQKLISTGATSYKSSKTKDEKKEQCEDFPDPEINKYYCIECESSLQEPCQYHTNDFKHITDSQILSRARATLPKCLYLKLLSSSTAAQVPMGVFAWQTLEVYTKFGPLEGLVKEEHEKSDTVSCFPEWKIYQGKTMHTLITQNESVCNWMMFVRPAKTQEEQNILAHQMDTSIYFLVTKPVYQDQELLFWFSKDYAKMHNLPVSPGHSRISECILCGKFYKTKAQMTQHQKEEHVKLLNLTYKCSVCLLIFSSNSELKTHKCTRPELRSYSCTYCGKSFTHQSNLRKHYTIHQVMKKFVCTVCNKAFRQKAHLQAHVGIHDKEKKIKCSYCERTFNRVADRREHEFQHTNERNFQCEHCKKVFYKSQNYKRHLLLHTGEKNFICSKCGKMFYTKYHLQRHAKSCKGDKTQFYLNYVNDNNIGLENVTMNNLEKPEEKE